MKEWDKIVDSIATYIQGWQEYASDPVIVNIFNSHRDHSIPNDIRKFIFISVLIEMSTGKSSKQHKKAIKDFLNYINLRTEHEHWFNVAFFECLFSLIRERVPETYEELKETFEWVTESFYDE